MKQDKGCDHAADAIMALTPREKQVFYMLLEGMKAKEISLRMSISVSGTNYFVKNIYRKLHVNSKPELVLRYFAFRQLCDEWEIRT